MHVAAAQHVDAAQECTLKRWLVQEKVRLCKAIFFFEVKHYFFGVRVDRVKLWSTFLVSVMVNDCSSRFIDDISVT